MYNKFSTIYEQEMLDFDYKSYMETILEKVEISGDVVEFGCGSGNISKYLISSSKKLTLVDSSSEMLSLARKKLPSISGVEYISSDISEFNTNYKYDYALSCIDVINYIVDGDELLKSLKNIYNLLKGGGSYIFDAKSYEFSLEELHNKTFFIEREDYDLVWSNSLEEDLLYMDLNMYFKEDELYEKEIESHVLRLWDRKYLKEILKKAGFKDIEITSYYGRDIFISTK